MLSTLVHSALFVALVARQVAAEIKISTPRLTQCEDVTLEWSGGTPPFNIYVVPSSDSCADSIVDLPEQSASFFNWKVNVPKGSSVEILVEDSSEDEGWTGVMTVADGKDSSCIDKKAVEALTSPHTTPSSPGNPSTGGSSDAGSLGSDPTPLTTFEVPAASARPGSAPPIANAASDKDGNPLTSGSIPRAALPTGSLLATLVLILTAPHI